MWVIPCGESYLKEGAFLKFGLLTPSLLTALMPTKSAALSGFIVSSLVLGKATYLVQVICSIPVTGLRVKYQQWFF